jgi:N-acetylmuramoyl-L-alanine amidase
LTVVELLASAGYEAQFVQSDSLAEICELSSEYGSDLFVSVHCNASANPAAHGTETWAYEGSDASNRLAQSVQDALIQVIGLADRGVKQSAGLYVLRNTDCPAVLVELAFVSNPDEETILADPDCQQIAARAIASGILGGA